MVAATYIAATMLSGAHHHHAGAICLRAALMHSCHDTHETGASGTPDADSHHGEEHPGCTYSVEILTASPQRQDAQATCQAVPHAAITQAAVQQQPVVQMYKLRVSRNSAPYTPPVVQDSKLLRAPPYFA